MDGMIVSGNFGVYLQGLKNTIILVSISMSIGLILAIPLAVLRVKGHQAVQVLVLAFVRFFRGTPLLIQMLLVYYGAGQVEAMKETFLWPMFKEAYFCALFTFCLNTCAYTTEILRRAIIATLTRPHGEIAAARAAGMSTMRLLRRIVLPNAFRRISTYSREIVFMLHGCVLTSAIIIFDISGAAKIVNSLYYSPYQALFSAAALYLTITLSLVVLVKMLKKHWHRRFMPIEEGITEMEPSA